MDLWACIALPGFPLEVAWGEEAAAPDPDGGPLPARAVLDGPAQRSHLLAVNAAARDAGIQPGHSPAQALALRPDLLLRRHDPAACEGRLQTVGALAWGFSSQVRLAPPAAVLLEVGASLRLFGGWPALQRGLRERLDALGHAHRIAAAPVAAAAHAFAGLADGFAVFDPDRLGRALARLPLQAAGFPPRALEALQRLGLRRLGELAGLPRPALLRRYGEAVVGQLDRLAGRLPDPWPRWQPPEHFARRIEFDYGIASSTALLFPLRRLLDELATHLALRDGGVPGFELVFEHEGEAPTRRWIGLRQPMREAAALFDAARGRLEQQRLPQPAHALRLEAREMPPFQPALRDLFDPRSQGGLDHAALVERLRARLGDEAVQGLAFHPEHRPERAWCGDGRGGEAPPPAQLPPRPTWLLPRPLPLRQAVTAILDGPERIESGWWDGEDVRREYVVAELAGGQRAWLFRTVGRGEPVPVGHERDWMLHGWFA